MGSYAAARDHPDWVIDLRSDTLTRPGPEMRKAMALAEVGDDVYKEDPTVNELEQYSAKLFGKEAALFVPSGTMSNLIAIMSHCWGRGQDILAGDLSHISCFEQGGAAQLAGVTIRSLETQPDGTLDLEEVARKVTAQSWDVHLTQTQLLCLENTHNMCGGRVLPLDYLQKAYGLTQRLGIKLHLDGARLMNAAVYLNVPAVTITQHCDTVSVCLSKSLGAPSGSLLVGPQDFIQRARRCRKVLGGGMRQSGILAAAGLYSFRHLVTRLSQDHLHAHQLALAIKGAGNLAVTVDPGTVQTNILIIQLAPPWNAKWLMERLMEVPEEEEQELGERIQIKASSRNDALLRMVLHLDVSQQHVQRAVRKLTYVLTHSLQC